MHLLSIIQRIYYKVLDKKLFITYTFIKVLIMIISLLTNIIIVRKLSVDHYGIYTVASMFIGLITTFGFSWSSSSILYFGSKEKAIDGKLNKTFWSRNIIIGVSLFFTTISFVVWKNQINDYIGLDVAFLMIGWLYINVFEDYLRNYFLAVNLQLIANTMSFIAKFIFLILVLLLQFEVKTIIIMNIISHLIIILFIFKVDKKDIGRFTFDKKWFSEVLSFSLWQLFGFSGLYLINFGDVAVIKHFMGSDSVGIYNSAYTLFSYIADGAFVISSFYASSLARDYHKHNNNSLYRFFYKDRIFLMIVIFIVHIVLFASARLIILSIYGIRYVQAIELFRILILGSIFKYASVFYLLMYNISGNYKKLQFINIFRAILNIVLDIIFINFWGIMGPAIATTLALASTFFIMKKDIGKDIKKLDLKGSAR